jgi:hypothetical protein
MTTAAHPKPPAAGRQTRPTWEMLVAAEPRLAQLLREIRRVRAGEGFCANRLWYGYDDRDNGYRERMSQLVGWDRKGDPLLGTDSAYDLAYRTLYRALPNCKHPGPFC